MPFSIFLDLSKPFDSLDHNCTGEIEILWS